LPALEHTEQISVYRLDDSILDSMIDEINETESERERQCHKPHKRAQEKIQIVITVWMNE
jgi:hypothetical protein